MGVQINAPALGQPWQVSGAGNLSAAIYDGNGRATAWTYNSDSYAATGWGTTTVTIVKNGATIKTLTFNGVGQLTAAV